MNFEKALPKKVKYVFHVHDAYRGSFMRLFKSNTSATLSLLEWARKTGVSKFIYLSSGEVYGGGKNVNEKTPLNPHNFYATTKLETEMFFKFFRKSLDIHIVRVFFPFGENTEGYIGDLYASVKAGDSIDTEYRTIGATFTNDLIEPMMKLRDKKESDTYNMCGEPVVVEQLVSTLKSLCGSSPKKTKFGKTELTGNSAKAQEELSFAPTPLDEALKHTFSK
jgi:nucleoside-diphosphate-sugar epimerase